MPRGRRPKPAAQKLLDGNPGRRPLNGDEPQPEVVVPECPAHLDAEAQAEWHRVTAELQAVGCVARLYRAPLAAYCAAWSKWIRAEAQVAATGGDILTSDEGGLFFNPWRAVADKAMAQMQSLAESFGMTPSAKSRVKAGKTTKQSALKLFAAKRGA